MSNLRKRKKYLTLYSILRNMLVERILLSRAGGGLRPYETRQPALL